MTHLYSVLLRKYKKKSWCKCIGVFRTAVCNSYNRASQAFTCTDVLTVLSYLLSYLFIICMFWLKPTLRMQMIRPPCRFPKKNNPKLHLVAKNKNKTVNWYCSGVIQNFIGMQVVFLYRVYLRFFPVTNGSGQSPVLFLNLDNALQSAGLTDALKNSVIL